MSVLPQRRDGSPIVTCLPRRRNRRMLRKKKRLRNRLLHHGHLNTSQSDGCCMDCTRDKNLRDLVRCRTRTRHRNGGVVWMPRGSSSQCPCLRVTDCCRMGETINCHLIFSRLFLLVNPSLTNGGRPTKVCSPLPNTFFSCSKLQ